MPVEWPEELHLTWSFMFKDILKVWLLSGPSVQVLNPPAPPSVAPPLQVLRFFLTPQPSNLSVSETSWVQPGTPTTALEQPAESCLHLRPCVNASHWGLHIVWASFNFLCLFWLFVFVIKNFFLRVTGCWKLLLIFEDLGCKSVSRPEVLWKKGAVWLFTGLCPPTSSNVSWGPQPQQHWG